MFLADSGLPIESIVASLRVALAHHSGVVVVAPPGSGKTTVLPLRLLDEPWVDGRRILVLEPRRLAARAAARRMASLISEPVGGTVGYVTRDERATGPSTRIEVVTEGVLTRRIQRDPGLDGTGLVIFDEIHERNLQTDLGLALCLETRAVLRPDLRIMAMSATIDHGRFAEILGDGQPAPVVESAGIVFPVNLHWRPQKSRGSHPAATRRENADLHVAAVIREALATSAGDVLVFLPGLREIDAVAARLGDLPAEIHRLHGSLPIADQDAALAPSAFPKVVLSTDIAESSLTVEGVSVVVDSGLARAPRFDAGTGMSRLRTIPISRASADQRAGRAGRLGPGVCFRLWSKIEHGTRRRDIEPEILQAELSSLVLETTIWGADEPSQLRFLDPPPPRSVVEARVLLSKLGLLDTTGRATETGRAAIRLPLHPRLGRMLLACDPDDGNLAALLAALIDERDPAVGPWESLIIDLGARVEALMGHSSAVRLDKRRSDRIRRVADDIARRASIGGKEPRPDRAGRVLSLAFPDRLAVRRGTPGRFQLRGGGTAWIPSSDPLAGVEFLVAATLDGKRRDARIRLAAPLERSDVLMMFADDIEINGGIEWSGRRLIERSTLSIGGIVLDESEHRAHPSETTHQMVLRRIASDGIGSLRWNRTSVDLRARSEHVRKFDLGHPDLSDAGLGKTLEVWLGPFITPFTSLDEIDRLDLLPLVRRHLGAALQRVEEVAPQRLKLANGRTVDVDYSSDRPIIRIKAQHLYGVETTPRIGTEPIVVEVLSPADRPIQVTSDLEHFWDGSWKEIRREMSRRYPKHDWPERPTRAHPSEGP